MLDEISGILISNIKTITMDIISKATTFAKNEYTSNDSIHQWDHIEAVLKRAFDIAKYFDNVDEEALRLAIIFHDIDYTSYDTHVDDSIKVAEQFLRENAYPKERIDKVKEIMMNHSTPHRRKYGDATLLEGKIIYDADKSIGMSDEQFRKKYFPRLYLDETRRIVEENI